MTLVNPENVARIEEALDLGVSEGDFLPSVFVVDLASVCNISCVMCPNSRIPQSALGTIDLSIFDKIIDSIAPYAEFTMLYWLGEPLLHPELDQVLYHARKRLHGKIVLSSNMTVFNETHYKAIARNVDICLCCLDRWNPRAFEKIRKGASFDTVKANTESLLRICSLSDSRCEVVVKGLDINHDSDELLEFRDHWEALGARALLAWLNTWAGTLPSVRKAAQVPIPLVSDQRVPCADLWFKMVISWQGKSQLCCFDWRNENQIQNDLSEDWLKHVWQGGTMIARRKAHLAGEFEITQLCATCDTWGERCEHDAYTRWSEQSYFTVF